MKKLELHINSQLLFIHFLILVFLSDTTNFQAQNLSGKKAIGCVFDSADVVYSEMAVISNVLKIKNNVNKNLTVQVNISIPSGWRSLNRSEKKYVIVSGDSIFVPVRLLTSNKKTKGGAKYNVNAMVTIKETGQVVSTSFFAGRQKISKMKMEVIPGSKVYFLNNESSSKFKIKFTNDGDENQRIILSMNKLGKDIMVTDTNGHFFQKKFLEFPVKPFSDTTLSLGVSSVNEVANQRRIDTYSYLFKSHEQKKQNLLFLKASELGNFSKNHLDSKEADVVRMAKSIDFVKLNSNCQVNPFDNGTLPISMQANFTNVLNNQPVMNLILNGQSKLSEDARLSYFYQNTFNYYLLKDLSKTSGYWQTTYTHTRGSIQVGTGVQLSMPQVRGVSNQGLGLAATYNLIGSNKIGFFISDQSKNTLNNSGLNYGLGYSGKVKSFNFGTGYSHASTGKESSTDLISAGTNFQIGKFQSFSFSGSINQYTIKSQKYQGFIASSNYGINYFKRKASTNLRFMYNQYPNILTGSPSGSSNLPIITAGISNNLKISTGHNLNFEHFYSSNPIFNINTNENLKNVYYNNYVNLVSSKKQKVISTPGVYVNYQEFLKQNVLSEGLQLNLNNSNYEQNFRVGLNLKGGFNRILNYPQLGTYFTLQTSTFVNLRTLNFSIRYFYGPQSQSNAVNALTTQDKYNQNIYSTLSHQYQFTNKHFVLENSFNYNFQNINERQTFGLFSQLFFYSTNGWRFNLNFNYNYTSANSYKYSYDPTSKNNFHLETGAVKQVAQNLQFGLGVKKDFSVPLPKRFAKSFYTNTVFKAFLDINGNRKFDKDEVELENVVVQLNDNEVQTNSKGECTFENIAFGKYKVKAFALEDIGAWFAVLEDSLVIDNSAPQYIPFSKGVQVLGNVEVNREQLSSAMNEKLDISRLKIFLVDSAGKSLTTVTDDHGNFSFYVPYGSYKLTFDERLLGSSFELMQNDVPLELVSGMDSYYHTFFIVEKRRKIKSKKFAADGNEINTNENK